MLATPFPGLRWKMARFSAAFMLTLPVAAAFLATPALAQRPLPPPGVYEERLPPVMGRYDDDDLYPATPVAPRNGRRGSNRALPYPDDEPAQPPPPGLFESSRGHQLDARQPPQIDPRQQPPAATQTPATQAPAANAEPVLRPPGTVGVVPNAALQPTQPSNNVMSLPPEDQPETGQPKELPANLKKQLVDFTTKEPAGTIIIDTANTYLYLVLGQRQGDALRHRCRPRRIYLDRHGTHLAHEGMAGLVPAVGDDRTSTVFAAHDGGRPRQPAWRARSLSRQYALSNPRHQPTFDDWLVRIVGLHPPSQRGHRGSLQPRSDWHACRRMPGQGAGAYRQHRRATGSGSRAPPAAPTNIAPPG